ncbi:quinone oxidoreductase family protein [Methylocystis bryophila]|uniref:Quinone oxidoreductase n=1 Tax=Methylocystis bryophila TaxID=655015 RepID=A0A1W6MWT5_9HYPH|nr:quinone oxidoreductase [Methylocystis bryophila]ARN81979.1 quinone oxidoreductase [Methylocystis bryophila]BDV38079.1 quinone oxidoreductase [Methylocystis bryophila]
MTTVKAIRVHAPGAPDALRYEDVELPPPGPGEAQIRHHAIGVNYIDVYRRSGLYPAPSPFIPGHEGAGEVIAVGEGVEHVKTGDRVAYVDGALGGYAEARNIAAAALVRLPKFLSYEQGAAMMLKGLTAEYLLRRTFKIKKGHRVLVQAGAGGVGQLLCQWASALGAKVIATVGSAEKAAIARRAGADHTILYRDEDFVAKTREFTKGKLCDVVYDGVGRATFPASLDCLKPFGMFVSYGSASGPIAAFDIGLLSQKGSLYATRPSLFSHIADVETYRDMTGEVVDALKRGDISLDAISARPLADAAKVHCDLEARKTTGSIVLTP